MPAPDACCSKCRKIGPKTAEKIKMAWEAAHDNTLVGTAAGRAAATAGLSGSPGLTMQQLLEAPPAVGFPWGPATRCYSPHLHAAEQIVSQRCLQRAGAYRQPTTRQLNRVRKWVAANQANTGAQAGQAGWRKAAFPWASGLRKQGLVSHYMPPATPRSQLLCAPLPSPPCARPAAADVQLNEGQVRAIEVASDAPLMVITGGPGCGKTTMVQTLVKLWCAQKKMVRIAAPTGAHLPAAHGRAGGGCGVVQRSWLLGPGRGCPGLPPHMCHSQATCLPFHLETC